MGHRVSNGAAKGLFGLGLFVIATGVLSGCASFGGALNDPVVTGSTATTSGANMAQAMPQQLSVLSSSSAKYLPPADIGSRSSGPIITNGVSVPQQTAGVVSQDLPSLNSSPVVGSTQSMPAQLSTAPAQVASTNSQPVASAPKLQAVPQNGYSHVIESGESLYSIARHYKVTTDSIVLANKLESPDKIHVGQKLVIPGVTSAPQTQTVETTAELKQPPKSVDRTETATVSRQAVKPLAEQDGKAPVQTAAVEKPAQAPVVEQQPVASNGKFRWPASGKLIADFAASNGTGINIEVPEGTAVRAAESGMVIYVGSAVEGYGNLILVKHDNGYVSAYAHLSQITVSKGDAVMRGDAIGLAGMTGSVSKPQLHFELRKGATPVDPVPMLAS